MLIWLVVTFTTSFDLPAFDRIHQAEWGDGTVMAGLICW